MGSNLGSAVGQCSGSLCLVLAVLAPLCGSMWVLLAVGACSESLCLVLAVPAPVCGSMWVLLSSAPSTDAKSVPRHDRRPDDRQHLRRDDDDDEDCFDTDFFYNSR